MKCIVMRRKCTLEYDINKHTTEEELVSTTIESLNLTRTIIFLLREYIDHVILFNAIKRICSLGTYGSNTKMGNSSSKRNNTLHEVKTLQESIKLINVRLTDMEDRIFNMETNLQAVESLIESTANKARFIRTIVESQKMDEKKENIDKMELRVNELEHSLVHSGKVRENVFLGVYESESSYISDSSTLSTSFTSTES